MTESCPRFAACAAYADTFDTFTSIEASWASGALGLGKFDHQQQSTARAVACWWQLLGGFFHCWLCYWVPEKI